MQVKPITARWLFGFLAFACSSAAVAEPVSNRCQTPIVLEAKEPKSTSSKLTVTLNGVEHDFAQLLRELAREAEACGRDRPVNVLVSDRRLLSDLYEIRALVSKAGLPNARHYVVSSVSGRMGEIMFGEVVPSSGTTTAHH